MDGKRDIRAKKIVRDIISGVDETELMHKYRLTSRGLQRVYRQLVDLNVIDVALLIERGVALFNTETTSVRRLPRKEIYVPLPVQDVYKEVWGTVTDITERGLGVTGIRVGVGKVKKLIVKPETCFRLKPFTLKAKCRWVKLSDDEQGILAGFEIIFIAPKDLQELRNLIGALEYMCR